MYWLVTLLLPLLLASCSYGYNVDLQSLLIVNSGLDTEQQRDYSFGFSLSHHIYSNGDKALLVGAPRAEYDGLREGGVYVCPLVHQGTCKMNPTFNLRNDSFANVFFQILQDDSSFDDQMLGYTIKSKENSVMVCAPMYIGGSVSNGGRTSYSTNGRCIVMPQDFNESTTPTQLFRSGDFAIAGIGADIYKPNPENLDLFSIGSIYTGRSVFTLEVQSSSLADYSRTAIPSSSSTPLQGYHIEQGRFLQNTFENLLASGPKASRHRGQVIAYQRNNLNLNEVVTIIGPVSAIDGYFGYDFTLIDLQTDNYDSLVVGCPLCDRDRGLVYVYVHTEDPANPINETAVQIISLPSQQRGQFGTAIENVGDIDQDGYEDVAISAPYQDMGVVYIYRGGPNGLITDDYQIITAPAGTVGFGTVITAAIDVDDNSYPDFTVGDLTNNVVHTFRSSPVVSVTISTKEDSYSLDYTERNCVLQNIPSICFVVTPCFNFSTKYGGVDEFAVKYTLIVDEIEQRVGLLDNILANRITEEVTIDNSEDRTCSSPHTFVLVPDFSKLDPIPMKLTITNADNLLSLPSSTSQLYGGELHPILSKASDGTSLDQQISSNYSQNCGLDGICDPKFEILVNPNVPSSNGKVPWASGFTFSLDITLKNTEEDSLASVMIIDIPKGIRLSNSEPITNFAISSCESPAIQMIRCALKNPILVNEIVRFRVSFRPDVLENVFDVETIEFNFTVQDTSPRGSHSTKLSTQSVASYEIEAGFGAEEEQANRFVPSVNQSDITLSSQGPSINYQVTVRHTGYDDEESPIPLLIINVMWPAVITLNGGDTLPLLVPTNIVGSTCQQSGAIPNNLLNANQQSSLVLPPITRDTIIKRCPENVTCGVIQCKVLNLPPQRRDISTATPPVQISIFSTLWSAAIRDILNVSVYMYVDIESQTGYPNITQSISESLTSIKLQPAVTETQRECFQIWIVMVSVLGGLILAFILVAILGFCGCFGRSQYKKKKEEEQRKRMKDVQETDGILSNRVIPPIASYRNSLLVNATKETEFEEEMKARNGEGDDDIDTKLPGTFAPFTTPTAPPPSSSTSNEGGAITDEVVEMTFPEKVTQSSTEDGLETEI